MPRNLLVFFVLSVFSIMLLPETAYSGDCNTVKDCQAEIKVLKKHIQQLEIWLNDCEGNGVETKYSKGADGTLYPFTAVVRGGLGKGWRDPSGLSWFGVEPITRVPFQANRYCESKGGRHAKADNIRHRNHYNPWAKG